MIRYRYNRQIAALLLKNEYVVIPKIGGFIVYSIPASIRKDDQQIVPPGKQIKFYPKLQDQHDGLINEVAQYFDLELDTAKVLVLSESDRLLKQLQDSNEISIPGVGEIQEKNGELIFVESAPGASVVNPELGLAPVALPTAVINLKPESSVAVPSITHTKKNRNWLKIAASLALPLCLGIGYLVQQPSNAVFADLGGFGKKAETVYQQRGYFPTEIVNKSELAALAQKKIDGTGIEVLEISKTPVPVKASAPANKGLYHIIGGCFGDLSNAKKATQNFKDKGFDAFIVEKKHGLYRVSLGGYQNKTEAKSAVKKANVSLGIKAWYVKV